MLMDPSRSSMQFRKESILTWQKWAIVESSSIMTGISYKMQNVRESGSALRSEELIDRFSANQMTEPNSIPKT